MEIVVHDLAWEGKRARVVYAFDLSDVVAVEAARAENARVAAALRAEREIRELRNNLLAAISHDFMTPLSTVQLSAQLLLEHQATLPPERQRRKLENIVNNAQRLAEMAQQLLQFQRLELGKVRFSPCPTDAGALAQSMVEALTEIAQARGQTLLFEQHGDPCEAWLDANLVRHILENLLANALRYSPNGSTVRLRVEYTLSELFLRVQDQGIGIPAAETDNIFRAFTRASNTQGIQGTGMGALHRQRIYGNPRRPGER
ncbi:MAG: hypothetical protein HC915_19940 [Anaerolineae bacterium]|nr:hypothetical protein [Anaerolineae bacterium]